MPQSSTLERIIQSLLFLPILFIGILLYQLGNPLPISAQDSYQISQLSAYHFPLSPKPSQNIDLNVNFQVNQPISQSIFNLEVYNSKNQKVFQHYYTDQTLNSNQTYGYRFNFSTSTPDRYRLKMGVFSSDWSRTLVWADNVLTFDVINTTQPTVSVSYLISPQDPISHQPMDIKTLLSASQNLDNLIIDLEIYDYYGNRIHQEYLENQTVRQNQFASFNFAWTPPSSGEFFIKFGVFTQNWQSLLFWDEKAYRIVSHPSTLPSSQPTSAPATPSPQPTVIPTSAPIPSPTLTPPSQGYSVSNRRILFGQNPITLKGISWFGFENQTKIPHGLWTRGWKDVISQIKNLGFNSVRLPYCPGTLKGMPLGYIDPSLNPELVSKNSLESLDLFMEEFNRQQIHVLLDLHTIDCQQITDLWYDANYSESQWIDDLRFVANRYRSLPYFMGIDIKNEPKGQATWGTNDPSTDWRLAAQKAGKAIHETNPDILIFIQGVENNPVCSDNSNGHWWGGNLEPQKCFPISPDFIPPSKLVFSPHVYGPDVHPQRYFEDPSFPYNLDSIWDTHFGFLSSHNHSIVPGEFGGKYGNGGSPKDVVWQNHLVDYFISRRICDSFYWDLNPNSSDTGGILKDDWTSVWQNKMDLLTRYWNSCQP